VHGGNDAIEVRAEKKTLKAILFEDSFSLLFE
jgi:hypothetical protein